MKRMKSEQKIKDNLILQILVAMLIFTVLVASNALTRAYEALNEQEIMLQDLVDENSELNETVDDLKVLAQVRAELGKSSQKIGR